MVKLKDDLEGFNKVLTWDLEEYKIKVKELEIKLENKTLELEDFKKVKKLKDRESDILLKSFEKKLEESFKENEILEKRWK